MKSFIVIVTLLCLISLPNPTVGLQKQWPQPSDLAKQNNNYGASKVGDACSSSSSSSPPSPPSSFINIPGLPNIPLIPKIPGLPNIPLIPKIPGIPQIPQIPQIPEIPQIPQIPQIPNIPLIPKIPGIPQIPQIPAIPNIAGFLNPFLKGIFGPFQSAVVSKSGGLEKCLSGDKSEKCLTQIFSSWAENDLVLDKECCEIVLKMDKKCNRHLHMMFKSHFFVPLVQYSCHVKHAPKN